MDLDISQSLFSKENNTNAQQQQPCSPSPAKEHFNQKLAHELFDGKQPKDAKVLAFKQKAPAPREGHQASYSVLFSSNVNSSAPKPRPARHIPTAPERILGKKKIRMKRERERERKKI